MQNQLLRDAETEELLQPQHQGGDHWKIKEYSQVNLQRLLVSSCLCKLTSEIIPPEMQILDNAHTRYIFFHADTKAEFQSATANKTVPGTIGNSGIFA